MPGFWEGGASAYAKALYQEYEAARQRLQVRLEQNQDPSQRQAVMSELEELERNFQTRRKGIWRQLFGVQ
jgi:hypothetical protein